MTRFKKEMRARFPKLFVEDPTGESGAGVRDEKAWIITWSDPIGTWLYQFSRSGELIDIPEWQEPQITNPYLVYLCDGDIDQARAILKSNSLY